MVRDVECFRSLTLETLTMCSACRGGDYVGHAAAGVREFDSHRRRRFIFSRSRENRRTEKPPASGLKYPRQPSLVVFRLLIRGWETYWNPQSGRLHREKSRWTTSHEQKGCIITNMILTREGLNLYKRHFAAGITSRPPPSLPKSDPEHPDKINI